MKSRTNQLSKIMKNNKPADYLKEIKRIFLFHYPEKDFHPINKAYTITKNLFEGNYPGYRSCNTQYHDFHHTLDATLAAVRLLDGYSLGKKPMVNETARDLIIAALFHDSGYIQTKSDYRGTGAKYTKDHVNRSIEFLAQINGQLKLSGSSVERISWNIQSTGLNTSFNDIPFKSREERTAGAMLGSADLLGQMADRDYLEKLLFLYYEFREAGVPGYDTEFDIIRKTRGFYELTDSRLKNEYLNVQRFSRFHFKTRYHINSNLYTVAIKRHMKYLNGIIDDEDTNFRVKLKRGDQKMIKSKVTK
ncbi:MAG: hypothetical protein CVV44_09895 [Spirochaetae bacterium HGW-Spirochaetae-1]|nr:MAG: hypothetical protein CVV44_09895 [Spirochaetae bacterium HGW-Spirochaetae-1]